MTCLRGDAAKAWHQLGCAKSLRIQLQGPFCRRDSLHARVGFKRHAEGAGRAFKDGFGDVVAVAAVVHQDVKVAERVGGESLPEVFDELAVEVADFGSGDVGAVYEREAAA